MSVINSSLYPAPISSEAWQQLRPKIRRHLWQALGTLPPLTSPTLTVTQSREYATHTRQKIRFTNGIGDDVRGHLLLPTRASSAQPVGAVLYCHLHGNRYALGKDEILQPVKTDAQGRIPGRELVAAGLAVLAIDAYSFGERQIEGIGGAASEQWYTKHFLWQGRTLWGMMLHDDLLALAALREHPAVDAERIAIVGMSMGGSRATWVAALAETPVQLVVPIAQMTRYRDFAAQREYNHHSIYYYVPGMLTHPLDMEHIAALAAPAAQHILIGDADPLSPRAGVETVINYCRQVYAVCDAPFEATIYADTGHIYSTAMLSQMLDDCTRYLA